MDWKKFLSSFFQAVPWIKNLRFIAGTLIIFIIILTCYGAYSYFFKKNTRNISNQRVTVTPFARVDKIDQSSIQVMVEEKTWELGLGVGAITYDNKNGAFAGVWIKKKF